MSKSERMSGDSFNLKDMSFEAKFTMDEEGMRGLAKFLKEQDDEILDAIFSGKQGLILRDPKRGTAELRHVVYCKDCAKRHNGCPLQIWCGPQDDDYCSRGVPKEKTDSGGERTNEQSNYERSRKWKLAKWLR